MENLLLDVKKRLKLSDEEFNSYRGDLDHTTKVLEEEGIEFQADFKLVFYSHMTSLAKRLKDNTPLDCGDDYPEDEVEADAIRISEKIITPINENYKRELDRLEIILAAIQVQLAMEMAE